MTSGNLMKVKSIAGAVKSIGAFCNTFDLHYLAITGLKNQFLVFLRVAVLHRFYCKLFSYFITVLPEDPDVRYTSLRSNLQQLTSELKDCLAFNKEQGRELQNDIER